MVKKTTPPEKGQCGNHYAGLRLTQIKAHCIKQKRRRARQVYERNLAALHRHERVWPSGGTVELPVKPPRLLNIHGQ